MLSTMQWLEEENARLKRHQSWGDRAVGIAIVAVIILALLEYI